MSSVKSIYIAQNMGEAMSSVNHILALAGKGLEHDRYAEGRGAWSHSKEPKVRHVTFIGREAIRAANSWSGMDFTEAETRRNVVTEGVDLNEMVGETFWVGDAVFLGTELCDPCERPNKLVGKSGFAEAFKDIGGLRAEVITTGMIAVGQSVELVSNS